MLCVVSADVAAQSSSATDVPEPQSLNKDGAAPITVTPPLTSNKQSEWVFLPLPKSSPAIGTGLQVLAARFFQADSKSQPSTLGAGVGYYSSDTWFAGAGGAYNFAEDRWRISGGVGYLDAKYDFYGIGNDAGDSGIAFPINQTGTFAGVKVLRQVGKDWYVGAGYRYFDSKVGLRVSIPNFPEIEEAVGAGVHIVSSGPTLAATYDTRDLNMNPGNGSFVELEGIFASDSFASDENYERFTVKANHYWPLRDDITLAGRIVGCSASDNAPFFDLCLYGSDNDLRGYPGGRYQDLTMIATQAELRVRFTPRWGGVVFGGIGEVAPAFGDMNSGNLLPAGGFGVRWMAAPQNKVNIRADVAWGKGEDALFYLSIGEAF